MTRGDDRIPVLYLAPWVDIGGSDKGTMDWFRHLNRDRFVASLITTQPSANRRMAELSPYTEEIWDLPQLMPGDDAARFIITFIRTRGVRIVHIMNSHLAFELLPEIASLPDRPAVVIQLHVEESDCSGYVRYVTTRFEGLVDAFSVSSQALSDRLGAYEVPRSKRRLIRTGVDAQHEFNSDRVTPVEGLDPDRFHVLFPARVTAQKDPLLMVEVATRLRAGGLGFQIHVLGEGDMVPALHERVAHERLADEVILHGAVTDIPPWYAACDAVLLTSEFEGLPYVAYEAMAMATPFVGPQLPGLPELVTEETGILVSPREFSNGYANALTELAADPERRRRMGRAARERASGMSLANMAAEHESLYEELLSRLPAAESPESQVSSTWAPPPTPGLRGRRPGATPLVSVIVPCFNHGRYLEECLVSIARQDYHSLEVIVVDDGSTDPDTFEALRRIEREGSAMVLRLPSNRGPSAARNAAIEHARGRYVLPVDADNSLLPGAVTALVAQLSSAGERIGFIYPNLQLFGSQTSYFEPPSYDLHSLLDGNYCDTSSLIDREILDRGFRYPEDVVLGHEDWDLVLSLAEHGIHGEPARAKTLMYRKGFGRSDLVDATEIPFSDVVAARHPHLFDPTTRVRIKAEWNPGLTVIALDPLPRNSDDALPNVVSAATRQSCQDFELVISTIEEFRPTSLGGRLRRVPSDLATSPGQALSEGLEISRGRWMLATHGSPAGLLADPTVVEKVLRILGAADHLDALAFADAGSELAPFQLLDEDEMRRVVAHTLCWPTIGSPAPPRSLQVAQDNPLQSLQAWLLTHNCLHGRQLRRNGHHAGAVEDGGPTVRLGGARLARARDAKARSEPPELPGRQTTATLLPEPDPWIPHQSRLLCRHYEAATKRYILTNSRLSPPGCSRSYVLGSVRSRPLPGTLSVTGESDGEMPVTVGKPWDLDAPALLGFVEQAPLPLFDPLYVARRRSTGQHVLIVGGEDPLAHDVDVLRSIGFVQAHPVHPRHPPHLRTGYGLVGLVRTVDHDARRHRYGAGSVPAGQVAGELGALLAVPDGDCVPLWIDGDGRVLVAGLSHPGGRPSPINAIRWAAEPFTWRQFSSTGPKLRAAARRAHDAARACIVGSPASASNLGPPAGYLLRSGAGEAAPLYGSIHPVTGDQMLSTHEDDALRMGYTDTALLGYLVPSAPVTGKLGTILVGIPWALWFGMKGFVFE